MERQIWKYVGKPLRGVGAGSINTHNSKSGGGRAHKQNSNKNNKESDSTHDSSTVRGFLTKHRINIETLNNKYEQIDNLKHQ